MHTDAFIDNITVAIAHTVISYPAASIAAYENLALLFFKAKHLALGFWLSIALAWDGLIPIFGTLLADILHISKPAFPAVRTKKSHGRTSSGLRYRFTDHDVLLVHVLFLLHVAS